MKIVINVIKIEVHISISEEYIHIATSDETAN